MSERESRLLRCPTETQSQTDILGNSELPDIVFDFCSSSSERGHDVNVCKNVQTNMVFSFSFLFFQTLQSLSCPGFSSSDNCQSVLSPPTLDLIDQPDSDFTGVSELGLESWQEVIGDDEEADSSYEDSDSACSVDSRPGSPVGIEDGKRTLWKGDCGTQRDIFQLGGELDLEQIERN